MQETYFQKLAQKAMYRLLGKRKNLCLPIDVQLHLFDHMINFGLWIWGMGL